MHLIYDAGVSNQNLTPSELSRAFLPTDTQNRGSAMVLHHGRRNRCSGSASSGREEPASESPRAARASAAADTAAAAAAGGEDQRRGPEPVSCRAPGARAGARRASAPSAIARFFFTGGPRLFSSRSVNPRFSLCFVPSVRVIVRFLFLFLFLFFNPHPRE